MNDLSGTDVDDVLVDLAAVGGGGDLLTDRVVVKGTDGDDRFDVSGDAQSVAVRTCSTTVEVQHMEAIDRVELDPPAGSNRVEVDGTNDGETISLKGDASGLNVSCCRW